MTYASPFAVNLGSANTGLSLTATIIDTAGATVLSGLTGAVEIGATGIYRWYYASFADNFVGYVQFLTGATVKAMAPVSPADATVVQAATVDYAALSVLLAPLLATYLSGAAITVTSPVAASGDVSIVRGDDYANADGRALEWANPAGTWPDLTGATITFTAEQAGKVLAKAGSVIVPTGAGQKVRVELTAAETAIDARAWSFDVEATLATNGRTVTLVFGTMTVLDDITP